MYGGLYRLYPVVNTERVGGMIMEKVMKKDEVTNITNEELSLEEVNVYSGCGVPKVHCMYDCYGSNDAYLSTFQ